MGIYKNSQAKIPSRQRDDYSQEEQLRLRQQYMRAASRFPKKGVQVLTIIGAIFGFIVVDYSSSVVVKVVVVLTVVSAFALLWVRPLLKVLRCPGCGNFVTGQQYELGSYCPECGHGGLGPGILTLGDEGRYCSGCGKTLKVEPGRGANYDTRACTHCGLILADASMPSWPAPSTASAVPGPGASSPPIVNSFRSTITDRDGILEISIPLRVRPFRFLFLGVWTLAWGVLAPVGVWSIMRKPSTTPSDYLGAAILLLIWVGVVPFTLRNCGACILGRDRVRLADQSFQIRREAFGMGIWRRYPMQEIGFVDSSPNSFRSRASIVAPYRRHGIEFGEGLDTAEADFLAQKIREEFGRLALSTPKGQ